MLPIEPQRRYAGHPILRLSESHGSQSGNASERGHRVTASVDRFWKPRLSPSTSQSISGHSKLPGNSSDGIFFPVARIGTCSPIRVRFLPDKCRNCGTIKIKYSVSEVAKLLAIDRRTLQRWVNRRKIPAPVAGIVKGRLVKVWSEAVPWFFGWATLRRFVQRNLARKSMMDATPIGRDQSALGCPRARCTI